jgi:serine O-acetyltransferase
MGYPVRTQIDIDRRSDFWRRLMENEVLTMFRMIREDVQSALSRDPAARGPLEVLLCYPGFHAIWGHRVNHWLWKHGLRLPARWLSTLMRFFTGIEIHPGATIGSRFFIDHGMGVVIGETAEVGSDVTLYHGVTLGGTSLEKGKRHPTLEDRVVVGAGAKILGAITIGEGSRIGGNAVVVKSVPANSVVVGVPGQVVMRSIPRPVGEMLDLHHDQLPDLIGVTLASVMARVEELEKRVVARESVPANGHPPLAAAIHAPDVNGRWHGEDFSI